MNESRASSAATPTYVSLPWPAREAVENWPDFRPTALLKRLVAHGVDFVVVGGIAMVGHGSARVTQDLDICYATDAGNLDALGAALAALGAKLRGVEEDVPFLPDARALRRTTILTLDTSDGPIDLLVRPVGFAGLRDVAGPGGTGDARWRRRPDRLAR